jgi:hypothetical protein
MIAFLAQVSSSGPSWSSPRSIKFVLCVVFGLFCVVGFIVKKVRDGRGDKRDTM